MFLRTPVLRPSSSSGSSSSSQPPLTREIALPRFMHEREILTVQLQECEALQKTLLEVRKKRKAGQNTLQAHAEVAEGFFVKTQIDDTESFVASLGLQDAYIDLELEEAIAYSQRREQYLRVALERIKDRINGLEAELAMDEATINELLEQFKGTISA